MDFISKYVEYLKDNPEGYWFKRKMYGYGWVPAKPAGWVVLGIYVVFILAITLLVNPQPTEQTTIAHVAIPLLAATIVLLIITWKKGEPLKWQWGKKEDEEK